MVPLGVFAMLVAGWYIQTRAAVAHVEALSRERVAAIEKGVPEDSLRAELAPLAGRPAVASERSERFGEERCRRTLPATARCGDSSGPTIRMFMEAGAAHHTPHFHA
jgi:hypothetical protein